MFYYFGVYIKIILLFLISIQKKSFMVVSKNKKNELKSFSLVQNTQTTNNKQQ